MKTVDALGLDVLEGVEPQQTYEPVYLDCDTVCFRHRGETLIMTATDGTSYHRISLRRCFPMSEKDALISVRSRDTVDSDKDVEIGILRDCTQLDPESQVAVNHELRLHYLVPVISRIVSIRSEFGFLYWSVETDRGQKEFVTRDNVIKSAREVEPGRWLLIDINSARFEVAHQEELDARSQRLLKLNLLL
jgi:hypothetical protein